MTELELTDRIRDIANERQRKTVERIGRHQGWSEPGKRSQEIGKIYPPATWEMVRAAENRLGFPLPTLLGRLWVEVGNGGFGPGYGLFGLEGGHVEDSSRLTLPELYFATIEDPHAVLEPVDENAQLMWNPPEWDAWPKRLVPICNWGCGNESALDCSVADGQVIDLRDGIKRIQRRVTFAQWMEDWVNGVNLWAHL